MQNKQRFTNMQEALSLYIEETEDSADLALLPNNAIKLEAYTISIPLDPQVAFAFLVRFYRIKHGLTQKEAAKKLGFANIFSYQRLETRKCNPRLETIASIKKLFPEFSLDYVI